MIHYFCFVILFVGGLLGLIWCLNLVKKMISLSLLQTSILLFFITMGKIDLAKTPVLKYLDYNACPEIYVNPVPQVLMLTAIVVGVATLSVGLALIIKIKETFKSVEEHNLPL